jgi:hypothetical protein
MVYLHTQILKREKHRHGSQSFPRARGGHARNSTVRQAALLPLPPSPRAAAATWAAGSCELSPHRRWSASLQRISAPTRHRQPIDLRPNAVLPDSIHKQVLLLPLLTKLVCREVPIASSVFPTLPQCRRCVCSVPQLFTVDVPPARDRACSADVGGVSIFSADE